jgi:hypothetical protein
MNMTKLLATAAVLAIAITDVHAADYYVGQGIRIDQDNVLGCPRPEDGNGSEEYGKLVLPEDGNRLLYGDSGPARAYRDKYHRRIFTTGDCHKFASRTRNFRGVWRRQILHQAHNGSGR